MIAFPPFLLPQPPSLAPYTSTQPHQNLEAQPQVKPTTTTTTSSPLPTQTQPQEYAYSGRGGAGNVYSPQELQQNGTFGGSAPSDATTPAKDDSSAGKEAGHYGRGGAGNYRGGEVTEGRGVEETGFSEEVVRDVEMGLREPEKAHLGCEKGSEDY